MRSRSGAVGAELGDDVQQLFQELCLEPPAFAHDAVARAVGDRELGCAAARMLLREGLDARVRGEDDGLGFGPVYALYIVGYHRDVAARELLVEAARLPEADLDALIGDAVTGEFGPALRAVSGKETGHLFELVSDASVAPYARWAACDALMLAVADDVIRREALLDAVLDLLEREVRGAEAADSAADGVREVLTFLSWAVGDLALQGDDDARLEWVDRALPFLDELFVRDDWRDDRASLHEQVVLRIAKQMGSRSLDPRALSDWAAFGTTPAARDLAAPRRPREKRDKAKQKSRRKQARKARKRNRRR